MNAAISAAVNAAEGCSDEELEEHIAEIETLLDQVVDVTSRSKLLDALGKLRSRLAWRGSYPASTARRRCSF